MLMPMVGEVDTHGRLCVLLKNVPIKDLEDKMFFFRIKCTKNIIYKIISISIAL